MQSELPEVRKWLVWSEDRILVYLARLMIYNDKGLQKEINILYPVIQGYVAREMKNEGAIDEDEKQALVIARPPDHQVEPDLHKAMIETVFVEAKRLFANGRTPVQIGWVMICRLTSLRDFINNPLPIYRKIMTEIQQINGAWLDETQAQFV